jgi:hypothetical protein
LAQEVIVGVDTRKDVHVAVAIDIHGRRLGERMLPTTERGCTELQRWALGFASRACYGVEGTGSYGAGLSRYLLARAARSPRFAGPTASCVGTAASPIPSTLKPPPAPYSPGPRPSRQNTVTLGSSSCGYCELPGVPQFEREPKP